MKKTVFLLASLAALVSCNSNDDIENSNQVVTKSHECIKLDNFPSTGTEEEKMLWLQNFGDDICEEIHFQKVEAAHNLNGATIEELPGEILAKQWLDIKNLIGTNGMYDKYIAFTTLNDDIIDLELINTYTQARPCFSIALFRSIEKINTLRDTDIFTFKNAKVNGNVAIMFEIINNNSNTMALYDFSHKPPYVSFD